MLQGKVFEYYVGDTREESFASFERFAKITAICFTAKQIVVWRARGSDADEAAWLGPILALTEKLGHMTTMDATQQHANLVMDAEVLAKLKRQIKGMKVKELQDRALQMELLLVDDNGKKKLKRDLQEEIYTQLTGCSDF